MEATEWAYIAGFFDGEGCILYSPSTNAWSLSFTQKDPRPLIWIQEKVGGRVRRRSDNAYSLRYQNRADIRRILEGILPFLVLKRDQAEAALGALRDPLSSQVMAGEEVRKLKCSTFL